MAEKDSAFLWETEALRSASPRTEATFRSRPPAPASPGEEWPTLREAEEATGIPISTLRKWIRRGHVPSYLEETHFGSVRRISMDGIWERADELGREIKHDMPTPTPPPSPPPSAPAQPAVQPRPVAAESVSEPQTPPGTMLVPIEAWDKMLMQLGNLHEAGQQLAEARERAAKAETEATFLRERLAELRHVKQDATPLEPMDHIRIEATDQAAEDSGDEIEVRSVKEPEPVPEAEKDPMEGRISLTGYSLEMAKHIYDTWRRRPRR